MTEPELRRELQERRDAVEARLAEACRRSGRQRSAVTVVGVTKYVGPRVAGLLHELGLTDLGESRPQELWRKAAALPQSARWHLIGHLQRNKVARTLPLVQLIHSVDSPRLAEAIEREAAQRAGPIDVLVEINLSGEANKTGLPPADVASMVTALRCCPSVRWRGLMTMAALQHAEEARPAFAALRRLRDGLVAEWGEVAGAATELSLGMSNDFEVAIEEGATLVRLGSCFFEGLPREVLVG